MAFSSYWHRMIFSDIIFPNINFLLTGNFEEGAESLKGDVVVELARGEEVVLDDGVVEDGGAVGSERLLVTLEEALELGQLGALDQPVEVHLLQNVERRKLKK